jgi:hypothetical protein
MMVTYMIVTWPIDLQVILVVTFSAVGGFGELAGQLGRPREHHLVAARHFDDLATAQPGRHARVPRPARQRPVIRDRDVALGQVARAELREAELDVPRLEWLWNQPLPAGYFLGSPARHGAAETVPTRMTSRRSLFSMNPVTAGT